MIATPPPLPAEWSLIETLFIAETHSSWIRKVLRPDHTPAVLKTLKPINGAADELRGGDYLTWRNDRGAVRLLDRQGNHMLLEFAGERMLSHVVADEGDERATQIAAELMAELYAPSDRLLPTALLPIRDRFEDLFTRAREDERAGCRSEYMSGAAVAERLISDARDLRGLHGDLHHENIMLSARGWLAIDPVGELGFGAANLFYDPADRDDLCLDPERIAGMARILSDSLRLDPRRLLDQAYAYGCLSAA